MDIQGFERKVREGVSFWTIPAFEENNKVRHGFSTRLGGVSSGECAALNLGYKRRDTREAVTENFHRFCKALGIPAAHMVFTDQVHRDRVAQVSESDRGKGFSMPSDILKTDGLITDCPEVALVTFYADCVPLFFLDRCRPAIGLSHAGWRGSAAAIGPKTVHKLQAAFRTDPACLLAGIGPSIGPCCFEVDAPVADAFRQAFPQWEEKIIAPRGRKYHIDLWTANALQLEAVGISPENISIARQCTCCRRDLFFSHRGEAGRTGSLAAILMLKKC